MLVHDLLLAGVSHHLLLVLHHPLSLAPELHGLNPHKPSAISTVDVKGSGSNIAGCCSYGGDCCLQLFITTMIGLDLVTMLAMLSGLLRLLLLLLLLFVCLPYTHYDAATWPSKQQRAHIT